MIDIVDISEGELILYDALSPKGANILQIQIGDLEYAQEFGIDLAYFLQPGIQIETESFKAYIIQRLTEQNVNVTVINEVLSRFFTKFEISVGDLESNTGALIR